MEAKEELSIYYQNVRGMRTKNDTFLLEIMANSYAVLLLCETWLNSNIYDSEFFDNRYVVFRMDRNSAVTGLSRGGGCLIAIRSDLHSMRRTEWELSKEDLWISIFHENGMKTNLNVKYIENGSDLSSYQVHFDKICEIITSSDASDSFVLFGDYNLGDSVVWSVDAGVCEAKVNAQTRLDKRIPHELFNVQAMCGLNQLNVTRNALGRTLDVVLSDMEPDKIQIERCQNPIVAEDDHHPALKVSLNVSPIKYLVENRTPKTNFWRADYVDLNRKLLDVEWEIELSDLSVNDAVIRFYEILEPIIDSIPKVRNSSKDYPIFYAPRLIKLIKKKARAKDKLSKYGTADNYRNFSKLRKQVKKETKVCFSNYISDCETKIKANTKCFFSLTKSLRKTNSLPNYMKYGERVASDRNSVCDLFASFFQSVFLSGTNEVTNVNIGAESSRTNASVTEDDIQFSTDDIKNVLKGFDKNKVTSPDEIPVMFYKNLSQSLSLPLKVLFNKSLKERVFPDRWKTSFIAPIFKEGDKFDWLLIIVRFPFYVPFRRSSRSWCLMSCSKNLKSSYIHRSMVFMPNGRLRQI